MSGSSRYLHRVHHSQLERECYPTTITHTSVFSIPSIALDPVAIFQGNAHRATFILMATALGKSARLHTVLNSSYSLRYYNTARKRATLAEVAMTVFLHFFEVSASIGGTRSGSGA